MSVHVCVSKLDMPDRREEDKREDLVRRTPPAQEGGLLLHAA